MIVISYDMGYYRFIYRFTDPSVLSFRFTVLNSYQAVAFAVVIGFLQASGGVVRAMPAYFIEGHAFLTNYIHFRTE